MELSLHRLALDQVHLEPWCKGKLVLAQARMLTFQLVLLL